MANTWERRRGDRHRVDPRNAHVAASLLLVLLAHPAAGGPPQIHSLSGPRGARFLSHLSPNARENSLAVAAIVQPGRRPSREQPLQRGTGFLVDVEGAGDPRRPGKGLLMTTCDALARGGPALALFELGDGKQVRVKLGKVVARSLRLNYAMVEVELPAALGAAVRPIGLGREILSTGNARGYAIGFPVELSERPAADRRGRRSSAGACGKAIFACTRKGDSLMPRWNPQRQQMHPSHELSAPVAAATTGSPILDPERHKATGLLWSAPGSAKSGAIPMELILDDLAQSLARNEVAGSATGALQRVLDAAKGFEHVTVLEPKIAEFIGPYSKHRFHTVRGEYGRAIFRRLRPATQEATRAVGLIEGRHAGTGQARDPGQGLGTGFLVHLEQQPGGGPVRGLMLTNAHVTSHMREQGYRVTDCTLSLLGDRETRARMTRVVAEQPGLDYALVEVELPATMAARINTVTLSRRRVEPGEALYSIGFPSLADLPNPLGRYLPTDRTGGETLRRFGPALLPSWSALSVQVGNAIQAWPPNFDTVWGRSVQPVVMDVPSRPGASGSPIFSVRGEQHEVIALNMRSFNPADPRTANGRYASYAVPMRSILHDLKTKLRRKKIGVETRPLVVDLLRKAVGG